MIINLVFVELLISSNRSQNLATFVSSNGASTSSKMHKGEGLERNTANNKDIAVKAFSPPDRSESVCNCFPGGLALISSPEFKGSLGSVNSSLDSPPPNNWLKIF